MRILGIDPGSNVTGYGVVDSGFGRLRHIAHGTLRLPRGAALSERLAVLHAGLLAVMGEHGPEVAVVERAFVAASARSALVLGHARGVALAAAAAARLPVREYAPREIKLALVGTGAGEKRQVQAMVRRLLALDRVPPTDAADALAAAICHAHAGRLAGFARGARVLPRTRSRRAPRFVVRRAP